MQLLNVAEQIAVVLDLDRAVLALHTELSLVVPFDFAEGLLKVSPPLL